MKLTRSNDVHRLLVEEAQHSWTLGLMAFAVMEDRRFDWMKHFAEHNNREPTPDEVRHWYEQQSERVLQAAVGDAENALTLFVQEAFEEVRRDIEQEVIVQEIRQGRRFLPQFGISVAGGLVSALLFAAILAIVALYVFSDPSPVKWIQDRVPAPEGNSGGQTDRK